MALKVEALDHLVLTVLDVQASAAWYARVLGAEPQTQEGRTSIHIGRQKINLHPASKPIAPHAHTPTPGSGDICLLTRAHEAELIAHLDVEGVPVEVGPVDRVGARGPMRSVYIRDLDANLVEIARYPG